MATIKRNALLRDLDGDYGRREGFVCIAWKDRADPDTKHFAQRFFEWPAERSDAASFVKELVESGYCVWKPTSVLATPARAEAVPSNVLSFEVDQVLSDEAWQLLEQADATLISSGTEGHVHVKVRVDEDLPHDELAHLTEHLARACGVSGQADSGGKWKPHDLLRVVGTYNTKHAPTVEVAIMRSGNTIAVDALRSLLASYAAPARHHVGGGSIEPEAIDWATLPAAVRAKYREIAVHDDASAGFRFFLERCVSKGLSMGQTLSICLDDRDGVIPERYSRSSLERQIDKVYREIAAPPAKTPPTDQVSGEKETGMTTSRSNDNTDGLVQPRSGMRRLRRASSVKIKKLEWLIPNRLLFGALNLLGGREGIGKSSVVYGWVADITNGKLDGCLFAQKRYVLVRASEDAWDFGIAPRLIAAGADMDKVLFLEAAQEGVQDLALPQDLDELREIIEDNRIAAVVFDPILSVLDDDVDTERGKALRRALEPINTLAQDAKCAVLGIVHFNKRGEGDIGTLISGHLAWSQVARATVAMVRDYDRENAFFLLNGKVNNAPEQPVLMGHTEGRLVPTDDGDETETSVVVWDGEADISAGQLLGLGKDKRSPKEEWLHTTIIKGGEKGMPSKEVLNLAKAKGYSDASVRATAKKLELESYRVGFGKGSSVWWRYPTPSLEEEIDLR